MIGAGRRRIPRAWILPLLVLAALVAAAVTGGLSRSALVDLVAWWPVWSGVLLLAYMSRGRRLGRVRLSGLVPLLGLAMLAVFLIGHLSGWALMPSASARLVGPPVDDVGDSALSARIDGLLVVEGGADFLYVVDPVRRGGEVALPSATEQSRPGSLSVRLEPMIEPGWYRFAGWRLRLSEAPSWNLALGGEVAADLSGLDLSALQLQGEGKVRLGTVSGEVSVTVAGDFALTVPPGQQAQVIGVAEVPEGWSATEGGWQAPAGGEGWVISVGEGSTLSVEVASVDSDGGA